MPTERHEIEPIGPFSLRAAAEVGFGPTEGRAGAFAGVMRLAFALDGGRGHAGAVLTQPDPDGPVAVELVLKDGDADTAIRQLARIVSLDHDGEAFLKVGERDPVIGALQELYPGHRPVLFHSPYEAAAWAIISARRPSAQAAQTRAAISQRHGETFELAAQTLHAFPKPDRLAALPDDTPGLNAEKIARLRAIAQAALEGELEPTRLHALGPERAYEDVQHLKGIGPFYAGLVVLRATGFADALLSTPEPKVLTHTAGFYGLAAPPSLEEFAAIAEAWRPFRTWCTVLIRFGGDRRFGPVSRRRPAARPAS